VGSKRGAGVIDLPWDGIFTQLEQIYFYTIVRPVIAG
jgi:hypothetical protein